MKIAQHVERALEPVTRSIVDVLKTQVPFLAAHFAIAMNMRWNADKKQWEWTLEFASNCSELKKEDKNFIVEGELAPAYAKNMSVREMQMVFLSVHEASGTHLFRDIANLITERLKNSIGT